MVKLSLCGWRGVLGIPSGDPWCHLLRSFEEPLLRVEERRKKKEERGKRKEERGKRKEERGKVKGEILIPERQGMQAESTIVILFKKDRETMSRIYNLLDVLVRVSVVRNCTQ